MKEDKTSKELKKSVKVIIKYLIRIIARYSMNAVK